MFTFISYIFKVSAANVVFRQAQQPKIPELRRDAAYRIRFREQPSEPCLRGLNNGRRVDSRERPATLRGVAEVAYGSHNPVVAGSIPAPATNNASDEANQ